MSDLEALRRRALPGPFHVIDGQISSAPDRVWMDAATLEYICAAAEAHRDGDIDDISDLDEYAKDNAELKDEAEEDASRIRSLDRDVDDLRKELKDANETIESQSREIKRLRGKLPDEQIAEAG
jgi:predicted nuclease with TOPRIM domain